MPVPDIAGFIQAQNELREQLGCIVTFRVPVIQTWPEGTKINPDTGLPYDSIIKPTSAPFTDVDKTVLVILKQASPLRPQADTDSAALGEVSGMDIILDVAEDDYPDVKKASEVTVNGLDYRIREFKPFSLGSVPYRWLIYGAQR